MAEDLTHSAAGHRGLITVFGGAGFLGCRIVRHLLEHGFPVRSASPHPERVGSASRPDAAPETTKADIHDETTVAAALFGAYGAFGIALGLGAWLPNILVERGFPIAKSLNSIFWMTLAFPCASAFMMYSLERFGRKPTAVTAFLLTAVFGLLWANAGREGMVLAIGFGMIFVIQLAGNSSQIFISEVFPTNARASGFGLCQSAGRVGAFVAIPSFLWIQQGFGLTAVYVVIAVIVAIAAVAVTQIGPEAKGLALDEIAPPTA